MPTAFHTHTHTHSKVGIPSSTYYYYYSTTVGLVYLGSFALDGDSNANTVENLDFPLTSLSFSGSGRDNVCVPKSTRAGDRGPEKARVSRRAGKIGLQLYVACWLCFGTSELWKSRRKGSGTWLEDASGVTHISRIIRIPATIAGCASVCQTSRNASQY